MSTKYLQSIIETFSTCKDITEKTSISSKLSRCYRNALKSSESLLYEEADFITALFYIVDVQHCYLYGCWVHLGSTISDIKATFSAPLTGSINVCYFHASETDINANISSHASLSDFIQYVWEIKSDAEWERETRNCELIDRQLF